ncbi:unnamed protein product [Ectocarpus sp. 6 AP-2014]
MVVGRLVMLSVSQHTHFSRRLSQQHANTIVPCVSTLRFLQMIDDVEELLSVESKTREAIEATDVVKNARQTEGLQQHVPRSGSPDKFKSELQRLRNIYHETEALHVKHTAGPEDPRWVRFAKKVSRGTQHKSIEEDSDAIDGEALQLFTAIAAKSSIDNSKVIRQILQDLKLEGRRVSAGRKLLVVGGVFGVLSSCSRHWRWHNETGKHLSTYSRRLSSFCTTLGRTGRASAMGPSCSSWGCSGRWSLPSGL